MASAMKVRVSYTIEATKDLRRAIRHHSGRPGLATRAEVQRWYRQNGSAGDDDLMWDLNEAVKRGEISLDG